MPLPLHHDDPRQLGPYRLVARLGGGGMGTVYLARSAGGRTVALKAVHPRFASDEAFRARFRLETDAARVIGGEYGAGVVDADPFASRPWLATEYVLGPPLDEAVELCGPLPERTVRALGAVLCRALGQLHRSDVVHRDLKPSNVLVTATGPKIIDFGVARALGDDRLTRLGTAAGTPAYMSPEQAAGVEHTSAGDVFALAGVMVFAATGHAPFGAGQAADLLYRVRYAAPDLTGLPPALTPALTRCLDKDPTRRPSTTELAELLADTGTGGMVTAEWFPTALTDTLLAEIARRSTEVWRHHPHRLPPPPDTDGTPPAPGPRPALSRRRLLAIAGGSTLAAAATGTGGWLWWSGREHTGTSRSTHFSRPANIPGRVTWWARLDKADGSRPPLAVGALVAVHGQAGLAAYDAKTGIRRWLATAVKQSYEFTADTERVYASAPDGASTTGLKVYGVSDTGVLEHVAGPFGDLSSGTGHAEPLAAVGGVVYLAARQSGDQGPERWSLLAVDAKTGERLWKQPLGDHTPGYATDRIVAGVAGGHLVYARPLPSQRTNLLVSHRLSDGRREWDREVPGRRPDDPFPDLGKLAIDGRHVYFAGSELTAVGLDDGKPVWTFGHGRPQGDLPAGTGAYGPPTVKAGVVYAAEGTRGVVALSAATGELLWEAPFPGMPPGPTAPVLGRTYLYAVATDGARDQIRAVDLRTHRIAWSMDVPGRIGGAPLAHERAGHVVWTSGDYVCALPFA
ncbi:serine/threonine-protein kinase [Streptomyces mobaraensis NBRC 13819 = DSM 40847]|uniref:Putative serine/threonine protein kinase n=1 Tax=Streptomyces mobaraensis (strain ATCC 29032 / DSM 40847 / JCM 4168 / NBRC 13819 / NCIMB 11159 / IPCR 16-22) TaxID=1223523 RepID=M3AZF4_STRM1|nr:serine/threonine-protein kinase [Streptomyces mobaraensis]EME99047.1 putative serine/threonine protein kinase [Streptomyces mobaraensis NBRC 13819 = DSM 40847]QTT76018.1 serine/threonine-protein kinase [Streptomyces mobaraensis NBRC 13819 = DSM 40847]